MSFKAFGHTILSDAEAASYDMKLKELVELYNEANSRYNLCKKTLDSERSSAGIALKACEDMRQSEVDRYKKLLLNNAQPLERVEEFYNNKYPKAVITYKARPNPKAGTNYEIDVRHFIPLGIGEIAWDYLKGYTELREAKANPSLDFKMQAAETFVKQKFRWTSDSFGLGKNEYWLSFPESMAQLQANGVVEGDCEDGAITMYVVALALGVPYYRMRINAGNVKTASGDIGHCYLSYCRETDDFFVLCDWCLHLSSAAIKDRKLHRDTVEYLPPWFSVNSGFGFSVAALDNFKFKVIV